MNTAKAPKTVRAKVTAKALIYGEQKSPGETVMVDPVTFRNLVKKNRLAASDK